ncbi:MAG: hypothetical protein M3119_06375, partial [Verrucomicrobiota bacterium]|nr:hypothetical protein [Verrucomicrobiota bacterium]
CCTAIKGFEEKEHGTLAKIEAGENELAGKRGELDNIDARIGDARAEVQRLHSEMSAHRSRIEFNKQRAQEIAELVERYTSDIASAEAKRNEQASQIEEADALIERTTHLLEAKENELTELTAKSASLRTQRTEREAELQELQIALSKAENRISALGDEIASTKSRRDSTFTRVTELATEIAHATEARDEAQAAFERAKTTSETEQQTVENLFHAVRAAEQQLQAHQHSLGETEKELFQNERAIAEKQSRLEILRQLNEEGEGLAKGSQAVLKGLDDPERIRPAVAGALVSALKVDREYIPALEAAFGRNVHAILLNDPTLATDILRHVANNSLGQAALALPELTATGSDDHLVDLPNGAISWAIDKIDVPEPIQPLVRRLLRGVALVTDLETAIRLKKEHPVLQFATVAGEFISTAGIVFGGSVNNPATSLLGRNALISDATDDVQHLEEQRAAIAARRGGMQDALGSFSSELEKARARHQAAHSDQSQSAAQILLLEHRLRAAEEKLHQLQRERTTLEQQTTLSDERLAQLEQELNSLNTSIAEQQGRRSAATDASQQARLHEEETAEQLQSLRLAVATEKQRQENLVSQRQPMAAREEELRELIDARRSDITNYQRRLESQQAESEQAQAAIDSHTSEVTRAEENVAAIAQERSTRLAAVNSLESELRGIRNSLNELHDARGQEQVRQTQLQLRVE